MRFNPALFLFLLILGAGLHAGTTAQAMYAQPNPTLQPVRTYLTFMDVSGSAALAPKSVNRAVLYSASATVLPIIFASLILDAYPNSSGASLLILGAMTLGPSAGLWYAGDDSRAWRGVGIRGVGFLVMSLGAVYSINSIFSNNSKSLAIGYAGFVIGAGVLLGSAIWDTFVAGPRAVTAWNARLGLTLLSGDKLTPGLSASLRF